jgi:hypothetical protein
MTITATIAKRRPTIGVKLNSNTGSIQSTTPVTIQTQLSASGAPVNRLDQLIDVTENAPETGDTLVYNATTDKYVVSRLSLDNVTGDLDGGTF